MTKFNSASSPASFADDTEVVGAAAEVAPSLAMINANVEKVGGVAVDLATAVVDPPVEQNGTMKKIEIIDMRGLEAKVVEARLEELAGDRFVMHGSNGVGETGGIIEKFDPSKSELVGKKPSVYATIDPEVAVVNAALNKHGPVGIALRMLDGGVGASSNMVIGSLDGVDRKKFRVPENMAKAMKKAYVAGPESPEWASLFSDGEVYLMPKAEFSQDSVMLDGSKYPTDHEWNSQQRVAPSSVVQVSAELIKDVLRFDGDDANVEIIPVDEATVLDAFKQDMEGLIPRDKVDFSVAELMKMSEGSKERMDFAHALEGVIGSGSVARADFAEAASRLYFERARALAGVV